MRLGTFTTMFATRRGEVAEIPYIEQMDLCADVGFTVQNLCMYYSMKKSRQAEIAEDDWERRISDLAEAAAKRGIVFSQSHAPGGVEPFINQLKPDAETLDRYCELMRRSIIASGMLGIPWITVHPFSDNINGEYDNEVNLRSNHEFYAPFVELAKKHNVGLAFENMARFRKYSMLKRPYCISAEELCELCDSWNDDAVGITWDFGHARMMISNQVTALKRIGKRLKATHVQDCKGTDAHLIPFIGGDIKWEEIMPVFAEIGYEGDFMLEAHRFTQDVPDELRMSAGKLAYDIGMYCMSLAEK